jgi:hypothetical protein
MSLRTKEMNRRSPALPALAILTLLATLAACVADVPDATGDSTPPPPAPEPQPSAEVITPDGWGPLRIGMTRAEVVALAGEDANPNAVGGADPQSCDEFRPADAPSGVLVMIEAGVLTRISVSRNAGIKTAEGLGVGDPAEKVLQEYGPQARVDPHKYSPAPAQYITIWRDTTGERRRGIRFEIDGSGAVVHVRGGGPSIEYVEGCA